MGNRHGRAAAAAAAEAGVSKCRNAGHRSSAHVKPVTNEPLSRQEKRVLRKLWADIKRYHPDYVKTVWLNALNRSMKLREIFGLRPESSEADILKSARLQRAAAGVQRFLEQAVVDHNLNFDSLTVLAVDTGARHADYYDATIQAALWDIFALCLVDSFEKLGDADDAEHEMAVLTWRKFVHTSMQFVVESYRNFKTDPESDLLIE